MTSDIVNLGSSGPTCSISANSSSAVGDYEVKVGVGTLRSETSGDTITAVNSIITVMANDGTGAQISTLAYPSGFVSNGPGKYNALDVTSNSTCNMVGDSTTDNTTCLNRLLTQNGARTKCKAEFGQTPIALFFPSGTYLATGQIDTCGTDWELFGVGPGTILKLAPNSSAFQAKPTPFIHVQSVSPGNNNFRQFIRGLTIEIGFGNPAAEALQYYGNNVSAYRDVTIVSDDSMAYAGLNATGGYPGPGLLKDMAIYGFQYGIKAAQPEYSITFEGVTLEGQTGNAIKTTSLQLNMQHVLADNAVPFFVENGTSPAASAILDSDIYYSGSGIATGLTNAATDAIYIKNLTATGYSPTLIDSGGGSTATLNGSIAEHWTGTAQTNFNSSQTANSLHLTEVSAPLPNDASSVSSWASLGSSIADWNTRLSACADATYYASPGLYTASGTTNVTIPDCVTHIDFYYAHFAGGRNPIVFTVGGTSTAPLIIDACPYSNCEILQTGSRPLVIRDSTLGAYSASSGAGNLFIEDMNLQTPLATVAQQSMWAWQLNIEQKSGTNWTCVGSQNWVLGYKTEHGTPILNATGCQTELFGTFVYSDLSTTPAAESAIVTLSNSSLFASSLFDFVNDDGYGTPNWVNETQQGTTNSLTNSNVDKPGNTLTAFYSFGATMTAKLTPPGAPDPADGLLVGLQVGNQTGKNAEHGQQRLLTSLDSASGDLPADYLPLSAPCNTMGTNYTPHWYYSDTGKFFEGASYDAPDARTAPPHGSAITPAPAANNGSSGILLTFGAVLSPTSTRPARRCER